MGDVEAQMLDASEANLIMDLQSSTPVPGDSQPRRRGGRFVPLKTTLETRSNEKIGKVYVTGVPAKLASTVLK